MVYICSMLLVQVQRDCRCMHDQGASKLTVMLVQIDTHLCGIVVVEWVDVVQRSLAFKFRKTVRVRILGNQNGTCTRLTPSSNPKFFNLLELKFPSRQSSTLCTQHTVVFPVYHLCYSRLHLHKRRHSITRIHLIIIRKNESID